MGIKPCRDCGKETSTEAKACPHCGATAPTREKSGDWVPCTKCGSAKTQRFGKGLMGFVSFMMSGCVMWIPVIGWVLAPIFLVSAVTPRIVQRLGVRVVSLALAVGAVICRPGRGGTALNGRMRAVRGQSFPPQKGQGAGLVEVLHVHYQVQHAA